MDIKNQTFKALGIVVVLLVIGWLLLLVFQSQGDKPGTTYAPENEIVSNFPEELLPSTDKEQYTVLGSYSVTSTSNVSFKQPVVQLESLRPMTELVDEYVAKLGENGWQFGQRPEVTEETTVTSIFATRDRESVTVTFEQKGARVHITVATVLELEDACVDRGECLDESDLEGIEDINAPVPPEVHIPDEEGASGEPIPNE